MKIATWDVDAQTLSKLLQVVNPVDDLDVAGRPTEFACIMNTHGAIGSCGETDDVTGLLEDRLTAEDVAVERTRGFQVLRSHVQGHIVQLSSVSIGHADIVSAGDGLREAGVRSDAGLPATGAICPGRDEHCGRPPRAVWRRWADPAGIAKSCRQRS